MLSFLYRVTPNLLRHEEYILLTLSALGVVHAEQGSENILGHATQQVVCNTNITNFKSLQEQCNIIFFIKLCTRKPRAARVATKLMRKQVCVMYVDCSSHMKVTSSLAIH